MSWPGLTRPSPETGTMRRAAEHADTSGDGRVKPGHDGNASAAQDRCPHIPLPTHTAAHMGQWLGRLVLPVEPDRCQVLVDIMARAGLEALDGAPVWHGPVAPEQ